MKDSEPNARWVHTAILASLVSTLIVTGSASACGNDSAPVKAAQAGRVRIPFLALGDVNFDGAVTAGDALLVLKAAVGSTVPFPCFDVDGSATEAESGVTAADALLALRKAVGSALPGGLLDVQELRRETTRWILLHRSPLGLIELDAGTRALAATYDQGIVGLALLARYDVLDRGLVTETEFTKSTLLDAVKGILEFYRGRYLAALNQGGFRGFAEFYDPQGGGPDYGVGAGGNLAGPSAYIAGLAAQYTAMTGDASYLALGVAVADWLATLQRSDGGLRFGTVGGTGEQFPFVSTEHNLSAREALLATAAVLARRGDSAASVRLRDQAESITGFLETVVWDSAAKVFLAGIDALGALDPRVFTDLFALAGMSEEPLPQAFDKSAFLEQAEGRLRGRHAFDLDPAVEIDGFGSFDASGVQNEWSAMMSLAYLVADAANVTAGTPKQSAWRWAYFFRQLAKARIDEAGNQGSGLAQAAHSHASGFGGFAWDSQAIAPASVAWWMLATLDAQPFVIR